MRAARVGAGPDTTRLVRRLRALTPSWRVSRREARWIAEQQAKLLLAATGITAPPVPDWIATELDGVSIYLLEQMPVKGLLGVSRPDRQGGDILIDSTLPPPERRVTLMHELKHIIDGGHTTQARHTGSHTASEGLCTDFALSVLIPAPWLRADWRAGRRDIDTLAERYQVPAGDMAHRLHTLGLASNPPPRRGRRARCHWQPHVKRVSREKTHSSQRVSKRKEITHE
ncbi:MAG: ImmA/IrrE family metallo-endopeptidase [Solirubrobacteraceae bacterium]